MNYFEHHIGDYVAATSHLSFVEDAAYSRLIRIYYRDEKPLPLELKVVQRLAGARTREEKVAVETVLAEFFQASEDGWHSKRCDEEIARFREKREKARRSADARWNPDKLASEADNSDMRTHSSGNANASETDDSRNAHQSPDTNHQAPDIEATAGTTHITGQALILGTPAGFLAAALKSAGLLCHSDDFRVIEAANAGVTASEVLELQSIYPDKPVAYVLKAAVNQRADRAKGLSHASRPPTRRLSAVDRVHANIDRARRKRGEGTIEPISEDTFIDGTAARVAN